MEGVRCRIRSVSPVSRTAKKVARRIGQDLLAAVC